MWGNNAIFLFGINQSPTHNNVLISYEMFGIIFLQLNKRKNRKDFSTSHNSKDCWSCAALALDGRRNTFDEQ